MAMKFMVINTPNGQNYAGVGPKSSTDTSALEGLLGDGSVEVAYVTVAGGHIYVVTAETTEELVYKVRGNPFFHDSNTEVIPIIDAVDFLAGVKKALA